LPRSKLFFGALFASGGGLSAKLFEEAFIDRFLVNPTS
jgi:hypothetical protein